MKTSKFEFHLGYIPLVLMTIGLVAGIYVLQRPTPPRADLEVWTFNPSHNEPYQLIAPDFHQKTGLTVKAANSPLRSLMRRTLAHFMTQTPSADVIMVEQGYIGTFFRGPLKDVGFVDLTEIVKEKGIYQLVPESRWSVANKEGHLFGVPLDVHPMMLAYHEQVWKEAGVDMESIETWEEFAEAAKKLVAMPAAQGRHRLALELNNTGSEHLEVMLLQKDIGLIDAALKPQFTNPEVVKSLAWYIRLIAGRNHLENPDKIAGTLSSGDFLSRAIQEGLLVGFLVADWRAQNFQDQNPELAGILRLRPLPKFEGYHRRTSTMGGTMATIPKTSKHPEAALDLIYSVYLDPNAPDRPSKNISFILSPNRQKWAKPNYHEPVPFYGGQVAGELFISLADEVPKRILTPYTPLAREKFAEALNACRTWYEANNFPREGLEEHCAKVLKEMEQDLVLRINRNVFLKNNQSASQN